jgi:hypothetical protein
MRELCIFGLKAAWDELSGPLKQSCETSSFPHCLLGVFSTENLNNLKTQGRVGGEGWGGGKEGDSGNPSRDLFKTILETIGLSQDFIFRQRNMAKNKMLSPTYLYSGPAGFAMRKGWYSKEYYKHNTSLSSIKRAPILFIAVLRETREGWWPLLTVKTEAAAVDSSLQLSIFAQTLVMTSPFKLPSQCKTCSHAPFLKLTWERSHQGSTLAFRPLCSVLPQPVYSTCLPHE